MSGFVYFASGVRMSPRPNLENLSHARTSSFGGTKLPSGSGQGGQNYTNPTDCWVPKIVRINTFPATTTNRHAGKLRLYLSIKGLKDLRVAYT